MTLLALLTLGATVLRALPAKLQTLPYVPDIVSLTPWFAFLALVMLVICLLGRRTSAALISLFALIIGVYWQYPFFVSMSKLPNEATQAVASAEANTTDVYARVMTLNVYKGRADASAIVDLVRNERIEVLALQETTDKFVQKLQDAGISDYLPYSHVSSSDGVYGNGIWSAANLENPVDDEVNSSASFMPAGTVDMGGEKIRFISVHTTSPNPGTWEQWKKSLDELGALRSNTTTRYVLMGDFNATMDHTPFREFLGYRFHDASVLSGHGFTFSWPANITYVPMFADLDHIVLDGNMSAGQCEVKKVAGSDHAALLTTIAVR